MSAFIPLFDLMDIGTQRTEGARRVADPDSGDLEAMDIRLLSHDALRTYLRSGRNPSVSCAAAFALACQLLGLPGALSPAPASKRKSP